MRTSILTWGSHGDVLPYISLALGLMDKGHEVILAAPENFSDMIKRRGIQYMPLPGDSQQVIDSEEGRKWIAAGDIKTFMKEMGNIFSTRKVELRRDALAACANSEAIICGTLMVYYSAILSEKLRIPIMYANVNPVYVSTSAFPHFVLSSRNLRIGWLNALTYSLVFKAIHKQMANDFIEWRKDLLLDARQPMPFPQILRKGFPVVLGYSEELLAKPKDWGEKICISGIWKTGAQHQKKDPPPVELVSWINAGSPPLYIGFGSMPVTDPGKMQKMIIDICKEADTRLILHGSWPDLRNDKDPHVYHLNQFIDLEWLFPRCSVLVHHGGVGTTHLGIAAGIPAVICSIFADNALWGERLTSMDLGRHIPFKNLQKNRLAKAIKDVQTEKVRENTARVGRKLAREDGLKTALDFIETNLSKAPVYSNL